MILDHGNRGFIQTQLLACVQIVEPQNLDAVYQYINFAIDGKRQAELAKLIPYGPSSQDAFKYLSPEEAKDLSTAPENLAKQFWNDTAWWGAIAADGRTNSQIQSERYAKWMVQGR